MRRHALWMIMAAIAAAAGYIGGRSSQAAEPAHYFDLDAVEMDRTNVYLSGRLGAMTEQLKTMAREITVQNLDDPEKKREKRIASLLEPIVTDAQFLVMQTFLLGLDNAIDKGGAEAEGALAAHLSKQLGITVREMLSRSEKSGLGIGGVALGYAVAKAAKLPPDEIFANKADNKSWPELMRARQVTVAQVAAAFGQQ